MRENKKGVSVYMCVCVYVCVCVCLCMCSCACMNAGMYNNTPQQGTLLPPETAVKVRKTDFPGKRLSTSFYKEND